MRKFRFSLEKMLAYKNQLLDREKNNLSQLHATKASKEQAVAQLREELRREDRTLREKISRGTDVTVIRSGNYMIDSIRRNIERILEDIARLEPAIERQTQVVVEASQEVSALEKLREKQLEEYKADANRAQQDSVLEFVTNSLVGDIPDQR